MKIGVRGKQLGTVVALVALGVSMNAFGFLGLGGTSWKEEVLLHDGSKIIVERHVELGGRHEIGQRSMITENTLSFTMPQTGQRIAWKGEYAKEIGYTELLPMQLGIVRGVPYLVTRPVGCLAYNKWKRPNPPYVVFRYQNDAWQQITVKELPEEIQKPNLIISSPDIEGERAGQNPIPATEITRINAEHARDLQYRTILREPMAAQPCPPELTGFKAPLPIPPKQSEGEGK